MSSSQRKYIEDVCKSGLQSSSEIPNVRSLLYLKSFPVFEKLHKDIKEKTVTETANEAAKEYGKVLRDQIEHVEQWFHNPTLRIERRMYLEILDVWSLCELLYFTENNDDISNKLMAWFNENNQPLFYEFDKQAIYNHTKGSFEHPDFWAYAIRMALLGQQQRLSSILKHTLINVSLSRYNDLLVFMLELRNITSEEHIDTNKLRKAMLTLCQTNFTDHDTKRHADQLYQLMAILAGDETSTIQHACTGIHAFISVFYYTQSDKLPVHTRAKLFFSKYPQLSTGIQQSFLVGDFPQAIEQSIKFDWWFLAHLTDLFHIKNMMDRPIQMTIDKEVLSFDVRVYFISYYASFIRNNFGFWREAFEYMMTCGDLGQELIAEHIKTQDMKNIDDLALQEMVDYCMSHSLKVNGEELYQAKARHCLTVKDYKEAVKYYILGGQQKEIDTIFYTMAKDFIMTGELFDVDSLGQVDCTGPYYGICLGLHRMNTFYMNGKTAEAAAVFKKMIKIDHIPNTMMPIIIWEGLKLIEGEGISCFSKTDILEVKKIWQKFNQSVPYEYFKLFHFYIQKDKSTIKEPSGQMILNDRTEFLNMTGVSFCRALERATD